MIFDLAVTISMHFYEDAKQTEMVEILRTREILSVCPFRVCGGGGGGTLMFSYIRWPGLFFRAQNFEFQYIFFRGWGGGGVRKLNTF